MTQEMQNSLVRATSSESHFIVERSQLNVTAETFGQESEDTARRIRWGVNAPLRILSHNELRGIAFGVEDFAELTGIHRSKAGEVEDWGMKKLAEHGHGNTRAR